MSTKNDKVGRQFREAKDPLGHASGSPAPAFTLHYAGEGLQALTLDDLKGKPTIISVVPSLDTPVCATQTKTFNQELGSLGDKILSLIHI